MTLDKVLLYAGIVIALSSAAMIKFSMLLSFLLFFVGLIMMKFSASIKINREQELFKYGDRNG